VPSARLIGDLVRVDAGPGAEIVLSSRDLDQPSERGGTDTRDAGRRNRESGSAAPPRIRPVRAAQSPLHQPIPTRRAGAGWDRSSLRRPGAVRTSKPLQLSPLSTRHLRSPSRSHYGTHTTSQRRTAAEREQGARPPALNFVVAARFRRICDPAVTRRLRTTPENRGFRIQKWSGARDLTPGPHGPEPCVLRVLPCPAGSASVLPVLIFAGRRVLSCPLVSSHILLVPRMRDTAVTRRRSQSTQSGA
jgi:hypothetical protein